MRSKLNCIFLAIALLIASSCTLKRDRYIQISGYAQGGVYSVTLNLKGVNEDPEVIRQRVDSILNEIDITLSGYNKNSLISHFNAGDTIVPNQLFVDMYAEAVEIYNETHGVVDAASGALFSMWGFGFKTGEMPLEDEVCQTRSASGMSRLNPEIEVGMPVTLSDMIIDGVPSLPELNYNAIAQGYSCDLVAKYLYSVGVKDMMVNIGEIYCDGLNPTGRPWAIGIDRPVDGNNELGKELQGKFNVPSGPHGVVTSGNYRKFYIKDGKKYAHSIDPLTGYPVNHNLLSATIVAENALLADAYATYCMVVGLEASKEFFQTNKSMEACLIYDEDGEYKIWCTPGFNLTSMQ